MHQEGGFVGLWVLGGFTGRHTGVNHSEKYHKVEHNREKENKLSMCLNRMSDPKVDGWTRNS